MIPFIDRLQREEGPFNFNTDFLNKFLSLRIIAIIVICIFGLVASLFAIIPLWLLATINNVLDLFRYIYIKIIKHPRFQKSKIRNIMHKWYSKIEKEELLYLGDKDLKFNDIDLKQFIIKFFYEYNNKYNTYLSHYNKNLGSEDVRWGYRDFNAFCDAHRRRSLGDVYRISKTYFPSTKIEEVLEILIELCEDKKLSGSYCNTIQKFVFHKLNENFYPKGKTEYGNITFNDVIWYIKNK